jgi:hypothetical protein
MKSYVSYTSKNTRKTFGLWLEHEDCCSDTQLLETMFELCNHGSGREHPKFVNAKITSLSVGDVVEIKRSFVCEHYGWKKTYENEEKKACH